MIYFTLLFCRTLIMENFLPPEDRNKVRDRATFDEDRGEWTLKPLTQVQRYSKESSTVQYRAYLQSSCNYPFSLTAHCIDVSINDCLTVHQSQHFHSSSQQPADGQETCICLWTQTTNIRLCQKGSRIWWQS